MSTLWPIAQWHDSHTRILQFWLVARYTLCELARTPKECVKREKFAYSHGVGNIQQRFVMLITRRFIHGRRELNLLPRCWHILSSLLSTGRKIRIETWVLWLALSTRFKMTTSNGNIFCVTGLSRGEFTGHQSFDVFFDLRLNKRLSKQSWGWGFETLSCPLWCHCNVLCQNQCQLTIYKTSHFVSDPMCAHKTHSYSLIRTK